MRHLQPGQTAARAVVVGRTGGLGDVDELNVLLLGAVVQIDGVELARFLLNEA